MHCLSVLEAGSWTPRGGQAWLPLSPSSGHVNAVSSLRLHMAVHLCVSLS